MKPVRKVLFVELIKESENELIVPDDVIIKTAKTAKVISKGEDCSTFYKVGDKVMFIAGQEYVCKELGITFLHDEDILGIE
jgi:co-chaperonin GroES (HSP10)